MMAENRFDASQEASMRFAWGPLARKCRAPRLSIETFADGNGNLTGAINIYLGDAVGGIPWRVLEMGNARLSGIPGSGSVDYITIVPQSGAQGIVAVSAGDAEEMTLTLGFPNGGGSSAVAEYDKTVLAQSPNHYWPISDASGSTTAADLAASPIPLTLSGTPIFGYPPLVNDDETSALCGAGNFVIPGSALGTLTSSGSAPFTVSFICELGSNSNENTAVFGNSSNSSYNLYLQVINGSFQFYNEGSTASSSFPASCGVKYHVAFIQTPGTGQALYINGMQIASQSASMGSAPQEAFLGEAVGRFGKLAYWNSVLPFSDILAQVSAAGL